MVIHYAPGPIVNAGADQLTCVPIPVSITGAFALHCDSYSWTTAGQGQLSGANTLTPVYTPAAGDSGVVILTLHGYGSGACPFIITNDEARIMVYTALRSGSRHADTIEYNGIDTLSISVSGGSGNYRYTWTPGSLLLNDTAAVPITVNLTYGMLFTLSVQDRVTGCTATDSIFVYVKAPVSQENCIVVHNVVTPNGDGFNDRWLIDCIDQYPDNKVEIFNRWGERIRIYTNYNNVDQAWTGTGESGKSVPDGTYYYVIRIPGAETLTGWVLLKGGSK
jgi:gliding motility-associated-like protein